MLRIIALIGNIIYLALSIYIILINIYDHEPEPFFIIFIPLVILFVLNIYFILGVRQGTISLYLKRKSLEEEIKIQESQNKLDKLKNSKEV